MGPWPKFEGTGLGVHREIKDIDEACALKDRGEVVVHGPARVNGGPVVRLTRHHLLLRRTEKEQVKIEQVEIEQLKIEQVEMEQVEIEQVEIEQVEIKQVEIEQVEIEQIGQVTTVW